MITAIISAISFYLSPYLLGRLIFRLLKLKIPSPVFPFSLGALTYFLSAFAFHLILPQPAFLSIFPTFSALIGLAGLASLLIFKPTVNFKNHLPEIIFMPTLCAFIYLLWRGDVPFFTPINWDFFHHQTLTNQILNGQMSFINSQLTDTFIFNGYSPLFHLLSAWPQFVFKPDILQYYWFLEFFHLLTAVSASALLAHRLFDSRLLVLVASLFSAFIFESHLSVSTLMLIPQTLAAVAFVALLPDFIAPTSSKIKYLFPALFLVLLHYITGVTALAVLIFTALVVILIQRFPSLSKIANLLIPLLVLLLAVLPFVRLPLDLSSLNNGEAAAFILSPLQKFNYLRTFSGFLLVPLFTVGFLTLIKRSDNISKLVLIITLILLIPVLAPIPYSFKFVVLARYPLLLIAAIGFVRLILLAPSPLIHTLSLALLTFTLTPIFLNSAQAIKQVHSHRQDTYQVSPHELSAAQFLTQNYTKTPVLLVSDPATQQILEPLTGLNTQGGAYMNQASRQLFIQISQSSNPDTIANLLWQIKDTVDPTPPSRLVFILSGRYFQWQSSSQEDMRNLSYNVWMPRSLSFSNQRYINFLTQSPKYRLVYQNPDLAVMEVQP